MELTSPDVIAQLLTEHRATRRSRPMATPVKVVQRVVKRRCQCGVCLFCMENARWDRIFKEKFADPDYYKGVPVRFSSPLR
ncbi:MAG TPA: hypothetical protein VG096_24245 [Bryobacteraceae bacterium]|jgi:hypothetical protein|nr:hypothetical protein [Bryobacteraceae bacterium]